MCKNMVDPDRPLITTWRVYIACCIPKATITHSEYVILIASPLQEWLHERSSMWRHIACLVSQTPIFPKQHQSVGPHYTERDTWLSGTNGSCTHDWEELQSTNSGFLAFVCRTVRSQTVTALQFFTGSLGLTLPSIKRWNGLPVQLTAWFSRGSLNLISTRAIKKLSVTLWKGGWTPATIWTVWTKIRSVPPAENWTTIPQSSSPIVPDVTLSQLSTLACPAHASLTDTGSCKPLTLVNIGLRKYLKL